MNEHPRTKIRTTGQGKGQEPVSRRTGSKGNPLSESEIAALAREHHREYIRILRLAFPERDKIISDRFFSKYPDRKREYNQKWAAEHGPDLRRRGKERYWADPEARRKEKRQYRKKYPEREREAHLRKLYGLTNAQYEEMLLLQNGLCDVCQSPPKAGKRLSVDHCHESGKIRGLLCVNCNTGIAQFKDDEVLMKSAIKYIRKHKCHDQ